MTKPDFTTRTEADSVADAPAGTGSQASADAGQTSNVRAPQVGVSKRPREIGGPSGLEPTRYGDWERNGRVSDF